jgi:hypothetical protein
MQGQLFAYLVSVDQLAKLLFGTELQQDTEGCIGICKMSNLAAIVAPCEEPIRLLKLH